MHPADRLRAMSGDGRLAGKHILLCVTGSVAAVETVKLVRELIRWGADVTVSMTECARRIVHPDALWFASGRRVIVELDGEVQHVALCGIESEGVDAVLVAPCTANMISKLACGICDDAVSTMLVTALGAGKPIMIAPGMHESMWGNRVIQDNLKRLSSLGVEVISPELAEGKAKMVDIETIVLAVGRRLLGSPLAGRKVTVIGGSTAEPIDAVRVITNTSTGGTAVALAKEVYLAGAEVELLMGECTVEAPRFLRRRGFRTVSELQKLVAGKRFDIVLMPAAVSDFAPDRRVKDKLPSDKEAVSLMLKRTDKVIDSIEAKILIGFKLEVGTTVEELKERARGRLSSSQMTAIVANRLEDVTRETSRAFLIDRDGVETELFGTREAIARGIIDHLVKVVT